MKGCLKFVVFFILGLAYIVFLATNPQAAILIGAIILAGYIFWSKQQKVKAAKEAEEQRKQQKVKAAKEAEEQRKQAIVLARHRQDLYQYNPSIQASDKRSTRNIFEYPRKWAESIEERYAVARKHLSDAELVFNDDVEQLNQYRNQLQTELIPKYETAIRPFFDELRLRDEEIPTPSELKAAIDFTSGQSLKQIVREDVIKPIS